MTTVVFEADRAQAQACLKAGAGRLSTNDIINDFPLMSDTSQC